MSVRPHAPQRPLVMIGMVSGPFVSMVDSNAVNVAVPEIASQFGAPLSTVGWVVSAYLLGIAVCLPASAWLAHRFGTRRAYVCALVAFAATSAACVLAQSIEMLVILRGVQGVASAPLIPLALTLLFGGDRDERSELRPPMVAGLLFFLAPALGPTIGGALVAAGGWQLIFLVNLPLIAVGLIGVFQTPADPPRDPSTRTPLDVIGLALLAIGATLAVLGASAISGGWLAPGWSVAVALAGIALLAGYVWHARHVAHPALRLGLLSTPASRIAVATSVVASVVLFAVLFLVPVFMLHTQGHSALVAGLVLLPQGITMGLCTGIGRRLVETLGLRRTVATGMLVLSAVTATLLLVDADTSPWLLALLLAGRGVALGLTLQPIIMGILANTPPTDLADATTVFNVAQRVGGSLGVAGVAAFYQALQPSPAAFSNTIWLLVILSLAGTALVPLLATPRPATAGGPAPTRPPGETPDAPPPPGGRGVVTR